MSSDSVSLTETVRDIQNDFEEDANNEIPIIRIQRDLELVDQKLIRVLGAPKQLSSLPLFERNNRLRQHTFPDVQLVRQFKEDLKSDAVPSDLYYFLLDICDDFAINKPVVLRPYKEVIVQNIGSYLGSNFEIERHDPDYYQDWIEKVEQDPCFAIGFPISEMRNPTNYTVIAHECLHAASSPADKDIELWKYIHKNYTQSLSSDLDEEEVEEVVLDIISLNYLGPVYALRILRLPERIGYGSSDEHMELSARLWYSIEYLKQINHDNSVNPEFERLENKVLEALETSYSSMGEIQEEPPIQFEKVQEGITQFFEDEDISVYIDELSRIPNYLGMTSAETDEISNSLNSLLLDEGKDKKVAVPLKPSILLNLLVLYDSSEVEALRRTVLQSFKKWYVTKQTLHS